MDTARGGARASVRQRETLAAVIGLMVLVGALLLGAPTAIGARLAQGLAAVVRALLSIVRG